jgi:predicted nucleic acid-binding protein
MRTFFDSSALAKRYVAESGTDQVLKLCSEAREVFLAVIVVPELVSAFNRLRREGGLEAGDYFDLKKELAADMAAASIVDLTPAVIESSLECLERFPLRALDALHLGAAVSCGAELFVSADRKQCQAARSLGLHVEEIV